MKKFLTDFKNFAIKGNVLDMAVGVVIGGAFGKIVTSLVQDIIMPTISFVIGSFDFTNLKLTRTLKGLNGQVTELSIPYGKFIQSTVDFLIIAFSIFLFISLISKAKDKVAKKEKEDAEEAAKNAAPVETQEDILKDIRRLLEENNSSKK